MRAPNRTFAITALLSLHASISFAQMPSRAALVARLDSIVNASVAKNISGIQVAVVKGRDTLLLKSYGLANIELGVAMTNEHLLRIGSVTKQFTSAAIMQLVEQGKLSVADPISKYIDNTPPRWSAITLSHLLRHTSGIQSFTEIVQMRRQWERMGMPRDSIVQLMARGSMMFEPGKGFYYNNGGYYLLGMIIEKVTGLSYADYVAQMVKPLGLVRTRYCDEAPIIIGRASGYEALRGGGYTNAAYADMSTPYAAGALCSTARDLVMWSDALVSGRVVRPATLRIMLTPMPYGSIRRGTYGMGITGDTIEGHFIISHGGRIRGFAAMLLHVPADSLIVAVVANTSAAPVAEIGRTLVRTVLGVPEQREVVLDLHVSEAERRAMIGGYHVALPTGARAEMTIFDDNGRLMLKLPYAKQAMPLYRQTVETFAVPGEVGLKIWVDMRAGVVREIIVDRASRPLVGRPLR